MKKVTTWIVEDKTYNTKDEALVHYRIQHKVEKITKPLGERSIEVDLGTRTIHHKVSIVREITMQLVNLSYAILGHRCETTKEALMQLLSCDYPCARLAAKRLLSIDTNGVEGRDITY